jgi:hypothetical protein
MRYCKLRNFKLDKNSFNKWFSSQFFSHQYFLQNGQVEVLCSAAQREL